MDQGSKDEYGERNAGGGRSSLPQLLQLTSMANQAKPQQMANLCSKIEELQKKVATLESKVRSKRKRIRRKSNQVDKHHECPECHRYYGSAVSLNLHLRLKHPCLERKEEGQPKDQGYRQ